MGKVPYDPIKDQFANFIQGSRILRRIFYFLLDLFFLRSWHIRKRLRREGKFLDKKGPWNLLDAGCGFGQYDRFILKNFKHVRLTSVDVKRSYLEACRDYFQDDILSGRAQFEMADLISFQRDKQFDFIICIDVLEHIEDDQSVIQNLSQSLKPGGKLFMHSPSHLSEGDSVGDDESFVGEHARAGYSKEEISRKYGKAGLEIENIHYTYGIFGHLSWMISVKYPIQMINKIGMSGLFLLMIYYPAVLPFCMLMNLADLYAPNVKGNGILALGTRFRSSSLSSDHDSDLSS